MQITANQNVVAVINVTNNAGSGDTHAIYNAGNRQSEDALRTTQ